MSVEEVKVKYLETPKNMSEEKRNYIISFLHKLPVLKKGQLSVSPFQVKLGQDGTLLVRVIIRNGSEYAVKLNEIPLIVRDAKDRNVAAGIFKTKDLNIRSLSAVVRTFAFRKDEILVDDLDLSKWTIQPQKHNLEKKATDKLN